MKIIKRVFDFRGTPVLVAVFFALFIAESRRPLRRRKQPRLQRLVINSVTALPAFTLLRFLLIPVMVKLALNNQQAKVGLNYHYNASPFKKTLFTFLLLDYTNYLWHYLNHKVPLLWRFHLMHHTDPDLDITTAFRFHFGEIIGSVFFRGGFVYLSGATPLNVLLYEVLFEAATQFHHSNLKLPLKLEKALNTVVVTPRMHGIHHSNVPQETDSNYSVIFSFWDRMHNTARFDVDQNRINIGVAGYEKFEHLTIGNLLKMPFGRISN